MDVQLLGAVQAQVGDRVIGLGPRQQRLVLAVLALAANQLVTVERLVELVWPVSPPRTAAHAIRVCVSALRALFAEAGVPPGDAAVLTRGSGYLLRIDPLRVDAHRFHALLGQARQAGDDQGRVRLLDQALSLWHGPALADTAPTETREHLCAGLQESRLAAAEDRFEALLRLGRHHDVVGELTTLVDTHPTRERLVGQLMLALHRSGQASQALDVGRRTRRRLREELGIDPCPELQRIYQQILAAAPVDSGHPRVVNQLPPDLPDYTGYHRQLAEARALLSPAEPAATIPPLVLSGQGGVGKTTFAVRLAHLLRPRFPDGQLFIALRGGQRKPVAPGEALGRALRALGVAEAQPPGDLDERIARYRSALHHRRVLLLLDDADGAEQVRPLLPGAPGCAVVVSTRARLTTLPGAAHVELTPMPEGAATTLLTGIVGERRTRAEPDATRRLVHLCAGLALALRIAGARLAAHPHWPIGRLADRMTDERRRLDELAADDLDVRASVAVSYRALEPPAQRTFRLLGYLALGEFTTCTAAALLDIGFGEAEDLLERLVDARLADVVDAAPTHTRYRMHDLVRLYARERARGEETADDLRAAVVRAGAATLRLVQRRNVPPPLGEQRLCCTWQPAEAARMFGAAGPAGP